MKLFSNFGWFKVLVNGDIYIDGDSIVFGCGILVWINGSGNWGLSNMVSRNGKFNSNGYYVDDVDEVVVDVLKREVEVVKEKEVLF